MEEDHKRTFDVLNMIFGDELPNAANEIKSTVKSTSDEATATDNKYLLYLYIYIF